MGVFFSIIIPVYNGEQYIKNCLDSIYRQGLGDDVFEVICVNDCSTDNTAQVISEYGKFHQNLRLINHETNRRQGGARNTAVKVAKGKYILIIRKRFDIIQLSDSLSWWRDSGTARDARSYRCGTFSTGCCSRAVPVWS